MKVYIQRLMYSWLIVLMLIELMPSANVESAFQENTSELDAYSLMVSAHVFLGDGLEGLVIGNQPGVHPVTYQSATQTVTNPLELRLSQVKAYCNETLQSIEMNYSGEELCEKTAIANQVCTNEISRIETALARSRRGGWLKKVFKGALKSLDPGRINFTKLGNFIRHDLVPDVAKQIVSVALSGGNVVAGKIIRNTLVRKARQAIKSNLTSHLLMSGVPVETIQALNLPAPQEMDLTQLKISRNIDVEAIRKQCQQEAKGSNAPSENQSSGQDDNPDMIVPYMGKTAINLSCKMSSWYYGVDYKINGGAPEWFDITLTLNPKTGDVTYKYAYEANFNDGSYNENRHYGEGKGDYTGKGWFSGVEQFTNLMYSYILNVQTGEQISSGTEENTRTVNFTGAIFDDFSQGVFCRLFGGYTAEQMQSIGKEGLLTWNESICSPCSVEVK